MQLRLDGSETSFEDCYMRAPFAPLIHIALVAAEAVVRLRGSARPATDAISGDLPKPLTSLPTINPAPSLRMLKGSDAEEQDDKMVAVTSGPRMVKSPGMWCLGPVAVLIASLLAPQAVADPIGTTLTSRSEFSVFTNALRQSGLLQQLDEIPSAVVFAVSNDAMEKEGSLFLLDTVLVARLNEERLLDLMSYHIIPAVDALPDEVKELNTHASTCLSVRRIGPIIQVGPQAHVTWSVAADNGTIYAVDRLLWQPWQGGKRCGRPAIIQRESGDRTGLVQSSD